MSFRNIYSGQRVLVTGHTGFKGSWMTSWLLRLGATVCGYSKDVPTRPSLFDLAGLSTQVEHHLADVRDLHSLAAVFRQFKPRFCFHLAAQAIVSQSYRDPIETITSNVVGTANFLEALRSVDWPCVAVIITSDKCYDNVEWVWGYRETDRLGGRDVYSGSKGAAELVFRSYWHSFFGKPDCPIKLATARAGNVIGGGDWAVDRIVADCVRAWTSGDKVQIRSPLATRPWQHVLEPLSGYLTLCEYIARTNNGNGELYNFGPRAEQNDTVAGLLTKLSRAWGLGSPEEFFEAAESVPFHEAALLKLNCDKALLDLKWEPNLSYEECTNMTGAWYRSVVREGQDAREFTIGQIETYERLAKERRRIWAHDDLNR